MFDSNKMYTDLFHIICRVLSKTLTKQKFVDSKHICNSTNNTRLNQHFTKQILTNFISFSFSEEMVKSDKKTKVHAIDIYILIFEIIYIIVNL